MINFLLPIVLSFVEEILPPNCWFKKVNQEHSFP